MNKGKLIFIVALVIAGAFFVSEYMAFTGFSGEPVNIAFGDTPETNPDGHIGRFYVANAVIDGDSSKLVFVPKDMSYGDRLELQFIGNPSVWKASLVEPPTNLPYATCAGSGLLIEYRDIPYREVDMSSPRMVLNADVKLGIPNKDVITKTIGNTGEYVQRFTVTHNGVDRTIYVRFNNLVLKSGDLPPAGDYDVINTPVGETYRFIRHDNLVEGTSVWNDKVYRESSPFTCSSLDDYLDYYNWINDRIPDKKPTSAINYEIWYNELHINYPSTKFTQDVTIYVPEELAEFIMIVEQVPEFQFDTIPDVNGNEGQVILVNVKGTAISGGTINLLMEGTGIESANWVGSSEKQLVTGKSYTFPVYIKLSQVGKDSKLPITVYSQPSGMGIPTQTTFYANIADISTAETYDLSIKCIDSNDKIVTNAEIYIDNEFSGYGDITKNVVKGNHYIYAKNVTGWYSGYPPDSPKFLNVDKDTSFEIPFTTEKPKPTAEYDEILIIGGIAIVVIILLSLIANEFGAKITANHIIIIVALIIISIVGYVVFSIAYDIIDRFITAIEDFKLV